MNEKAAATDEAEGRRARRKASFSILAVLILAAAGIYFQPPWLYPWLKVLHVIAVISWMAGLLYLPRIFVYHADADPGSELAYTFAIMEQRLLKVIMAPAMMITWAAGLMLAWTGFGFSGFWLWIKILAVCGLTAFHLYLRRSARNFAAGHNVVPARRWRMYNEIPTVLMIIAVIMVIVKPFSQGW